MTTMSAVSRATSVPATPIAIPTSAMARAGAAFTPAPTSAIPPGPGREVQAPREHAGARVAELEVLVGELLAVDRLAAGAGVVGEVAALDHESGHDTVKAGAIVKPIVGQLGEVFHRAGGDIGPKFYGYFPLGGLDSRVWICVFAHVKACISQIVRCDRQWGIFRVMPG